MYDKLHEKQFISSFRSIHDGFTLHLRFVSGTNSLQNSTVKELSKGACLKRCPKYSREHSIQL